MQVCKDSFFQLFDVLSQDDEFLVRQHLAEQLKGVADVCVRQGGEAGYQTMCNDILPIVQRLLQDGQAEVRVAAGETLVAAAAWIKREDLGPVVLTIVLAMAHDDGSEDMRMLSAVLLNELADTLGPELCYQFVIPEVIALAEDPVFKVRKAAALNLDAVFRTSGPAHATKRLLPAYLRLASDDIWGVRKAAAESIVSVSKCLDPAVRVSEMVPLMERFTSDASKWVRSAANQHLGPFIATLPRGKVSQVLLNAYVRMGLSTDQMMIMATQPGGAGSNAAAGGGGAAASALPARTGSDPTDAELAVYCSFSLPAVALTLGKSRWGDQLRALFAALSRDVQRKVRKPLAHALHELARILGPEISEVDLVPAFDIFIHDVDEVKSGVVKGLSSFLGALSPASREMFLPVLDDILKASMPHNWRCRRMLAAQIGQLSTLFSAAATHEVVTPLALALLSDPVFVVREEAAAGLPALLNRLGQVDAGMQGEVIEKLLQYKDSRCYRDRLLFIHVCAAVSASCDVNLFRRHFVHPFLLSAGDSVRNVRVALAEQLKRYTPYIIALEDRQRQQQAVPSSDGTGSAASSLGVAPVEQPIDGGGSHEAEGAALAPSAAATAAGDGASTVVSNGNASASVPQAPQQQQQQANGADADADDDTFPMWAREDLIADRLLPSALHALANDIDAEVIATLGDAWVGRHRDAGVSLPTARQYVLDRAKAPEASSAALEAQGSSATVAVADGGSGVDASGVAGAGAGQVVSSEPGFTAAIVDLSQPDEAAAAVIAKRRASLTALAAHQSGGGVGSTPVDALSPPAMAAVLHAHPDWSDAAEAEALPMEVEADAVPDNLEGEYGIGAAIADTGIVHHRSGSSIGGGVTRSRSRSSSGGSGTGAGAVGGAVTASHANATAAAQAAMEADLGWDTAIAAVSSTGAPSVAAVSGLQPAAGSDGGGGSDSIWAAAAASQLQPAVPPPVPALSSTVAQQQNNLAVDGSAAGGDAGFVVAEVPATVVHATGPSSEAPRAPPLPPP